MTSSSLLKAGRTTPFDLVCGCKGITFFLPGKLFDAFFSKKVLMKAEGFGVAEWNCLDGNTLNRIRIFWRRTPFSAPERHGRNRRCDGKVWTDWRTERERGKGTPPGRRGYTDAGTGHGAAAPGKEKVMPVVRMLQISPGLRQRLDGAPSRLCDMVTKAL